MPPVLFPSQYLTVRHQSDWSFESIKLLSTGVANVSTILRNIDLQCQTLLRIPQGVWEEQGESKPVEMLLNKTLQNVSKYAFRFLDVSDSVACKLVYNPQVSRFKIFNNPVQSLKACVIWIHFELLLLFLKALLEVVNDLFEEQTDLEKIVRKIMQRALTLLQCERCSVLLLEDIHSPVRSLFSFLSWFGLSLFFVFSCFSLYFPPFLTNSPVHPLIAFT